MDIEITVWAVNATTPPEEVARAALAEQIAWTGSDETRQLFDPAGGTFLSAEVFARSALAQGAGVNGPAIVVEDETTLVLPKSRYTLSQPDGCLDIRTKG